MALMIDYNDNNYDTNKNFPTKVQIYKRYIKRVNNLYNIVNIILYICTVYIYNYQYWTVKVMYVVHSKLQIQPFQLRTGTGLFTLLIPSTSVYRPLKECTMNECHKPHFTPYNTTMMHALCALYKIVQLYTCTILFAAIANSVTRVVSTDTHNLLLLATAVPTSS